MPVFLQMKGSLKLKYRMAHLANGKIVCILVIFIFMSYVRKLYTSSGCKEAAVWLIAQASDKCRKFVHISHAGNAVTQPMTVTKRIFLFLLYKCYDCV
jgi:hypothetical protein